MQNPIPPSTQPNSTLKAFNRKIWGLAVMTAGLLFALIYLSDTSLYHIRGLTQTNLDIALMLTPWGIFHNFCLSTNHWLRPFYFGPAERYGLLQDQGLRVAVAFVLGFGLAILFVGYRKS